MITYVTVLATGKYERDLTAPNNQVGYVICHN
jgi:hypothetical protein